MASIKNEYALLCRHFEPDLGEMALAFVIERPFVSSTLIGATNIEQLRSNIDSQSVKLSTAVPLTFDEFG